MASSAYDSLESQRSSLKRPASRLAECPATPRTPTRSRIPVPVVCPDAPRKLRKVGMGFTPSIWTGKTGGGDIQQPLPLWTGGRPLESFKFDDEDFVPENIALPVVPKRISDMPDLVQPEVESTDTLLSHPSPLPKINLPKFDSSHTTSSLTDGPRKRLRVLTQRQLKFDTASGSPPAPFAFPKLPEFDFQGFRLPRDQP